MNDILENLKQMKEDQCPFVNICEGKVKCIDGRYTQGVICLSKKHIECTKIQQLQKEKEQMQYEITTMNDTIKNFKKENQELRTKLEKLENDNFNEWYFKKTGKVD